MKNKDLILSTSRNLNFYLIDYKDSKVLNEFDNILNTIYLSKVNTTESIYENDFENVIYLKRIVLNSIIKNVVLKQKDKIYVIQDRKDDLDLLIPIDKDNKIYVYKDYKVLDMLSQEKDITYMFENVNDVLTDYEILEVKFNGKKLENYTFDKTLKKISIGSNILDYQYLNNIQILLAKKITNINDIEFIVEHIDHRVFDKVDPLSEVARSYFNLSYIMNGYDIKRGNNELFEINSVKNDKAIHKKSKNFRTELNIKIRNIAEEESTGNYGSGLYGHGLYGGGNLTLAGILNRQIRFRFIIYDTLSGEITIINNCKANDDYSRNYMEDGNLIDYTINGDRDIVYISKATKNGYIWYELCNL